MNNVFCKHLNSWSLYIVTLIWVLKLEYSGTTRGGVGGDVRGLNYLTNLSVAKRENVFFYIS